MNWWPGTLAGRTIAVLAAGLIVSNLIGLLILEGERDSALNHAADVALAERFATTVNILERTAYTNRAEVSCRQAAPGFAPQFASKPAVPSGQTAWRVRSISRIVSEFLGEPETSRLRLSDKEGEGSAVRNAYRTVLDRCLGSMMGSGAMMRGTKDSAMSMAAKMQPMMRTESKEPVLRLSYQLEGGGWLNVWALAPAVEPLWKSRFFLGFFVMAGLVVLLSVWLVRKMTAPLALFSRAADRLGRDVNAPDLPENGPREVRQAARVFNEMQMRLRRLVGGRTQMLAAISHDLRTPITRLRLRTEFVEDDEQRQKMLSDLEQMEAMISATLAFARQEGQEEASESIDLATLLQSVCDDAADIGQDVRYAGVDHAIFEGRPLALQRAFSNLIENAIKYGDQARVQFVVTVDQYQISFEDAGPGIPESEFERVFEPFYRIEASRNPETGGIGLGLASVRSIIRGHGGEVSLYNREQGGLRVVVILPRQQAA